MSHTHINVFFDLISILCLNFILNNFLFFIFVFCFNDFNELIFSEVL